MLSITLFARRNPSIDGVKARFESRYKCVDGEDALEWPNHESSNVKLRHDAEPVSMLFRETAVARDRCRPIGGQCVVQCPASPHHEACKRCEWQMSSWLRHTSHRPSSLSVYRERDSYKRV